METQPSAAGQQLTSLLGIIKGMLAHQKDVPPAARLLLPGLQALLEPVLKELRSTFGPGEDLVVARKQEIDRLIAAYEKANAGVSEAAVAKAVERVVSAAAATWQQRRSSLEERERQISASEARITQRESDLRDKEARLVKDSQNSQLEFNRLSVQRQTYASDKQALENEAARLKEREKNAAALESSATAKLAEAKALQAQHADMETRLADLESRLAAGPASSGSDQAKINQLLALKGEEIFEVFQRAKLLVA